MSGPKSSFILCKCRTTVGAQWRVPEGDPENVEQGVWRKRPEPNEEARQAINPLESNSNPPATRVPAPATPCPSST